MRKRLFSEVQLSWLAIGVGGGLLLLAILTGTGCSRASTTSEQVIAYDNMAKRCNESCSGMVHNGCYSGPAFAGWAVTSESDTLPGTCRCLPLPQPSLEEIATCGEPAKQGAQQVRDRWEVMP